jgi:hypothetical protein
MASCDWPWLFKCCFHGERVGDVDFCVAYALFEELLGWWDQI